MDSRSVAEGYSGSGSIDPFDENQNTPINSESIMLLVTIIICCIGLPLNGIVIKLLGFKIKKTPFTVLILNLAIADFGFLLSMAILSIFLFANKSDITQLFFFSYSKIMYITGVFLLTAISIDRCVSVLFPIWHRYSRPKYLSPLVCSFLWIFSFLLVGIPNIMKPVFQYAFIQDVYFLVTVVLSFPLITISVVILIIKIYLKPKKLKRGRLLVMILIILLCFFIFSIPLWIYAFTTHFLDMNYSDKFPDLDSYFKLCASLNSSFNPVIYFLVGRKKLGPSLENTMVIFQSVFKEDEAFETG
ncbi:mas-related G-protein coupled receptor member H-like [Thamnophis elegans]|uniref:mas-related G-protein coupled receptor member H-like n=1 Tax=Thamnophis elegans TaxID=35005 RepID=UPI00137909FF|nr:mas-related G-protein coupled receptor member H-like [Thamnophis elegans]